MTKAYSLEHLNADDFVELPLEAAVVFQQQLDTTGCQIRLRNPFGGVLILRRANGCRGDARPEIPRGIDGEGAPAAADFQDAVAGFDSQLAADEIELLLLSGVERIFAAAEICAGIEHLRIEEKAVKAVSHVVMGSNIAPAALHAVGPPPVLEARG